MHKTTFVTKWGFSQYTVMSFGLKNALAIFSRVVVDAFKYFIQKFLQVYMDDWTVYGSILGLFGKPTTDSRKMSTTSDHT